MTGYGVFAGPDGVRRLGWRVDDAVLDLGELAQRHRPDLASYLTAGSLDPLLSAGPGAWSETLAAVTEWVGGDAERVPLDEVTLHLPWTVADYVDFYASEHHASNLGRMFRPDQDPLTPNWKHLPIGYHGRSGTVVVSGTEVRRPCGQRRTPDGEIVFGPSTRLDIEAEVGFVVGAPSGLGSPVPLDAFTDHVFGVCLVNDWSARDIQAWEYVPLGPFLGKSFATSVSPWVVPLGVLQHARVAPPPRDPRPLPYLDDTDAEPWGLDLRLEVRLNGEVVSRPPFATTYWTPAQMLAHMTVNGASLRSGDLYASGTVSGPEPDQWGSLIEIGRGFLEDGDEVVISATAPGPDGAVIDLGDVRGRILEAKDPASL